MLPYDHQTVVSSPFTKEGSSQRSNWAVLIPQSVAGEGLLIGMEFEMSCCQNNRDPLYCHFEQEAELTKFGVNVVKVTLFYL